MTAPPRRVIVMGVAGSGKTSLGRALAPCLGAGLGAGPGAAIQPTPSAPTPPFLDADDYHTPQARARMHAGTGLTDADRAPWLATLRTELLAHPQVVLACSALRRRYRDELRVPGAVFLFLDAPEPLLRARLAQRRGHYAGPALLASQLATLERPAPGETDVLSLPLRADETLPGLLNRALNALGLPAAAPADP